MKLLEIIELRSVRANRAMLKKQLKSLFTDLMEAEKTQKIKIYYRIGVDTDFSIHIFLDSEEPDNNGSPLGLRLSDELKEYGLISHTVWAEEDT